MLLTKSQRKRRRVPYYKRLARRAVSRAVRAGLLRRTADVCCYLCTDYPAHGYHHYHGYGRKHRLCVVALCDECHCYIDGEADRCRREMTMPCRFRRTV